MNRIWSPWRLEYVQGDKPSGCIFCDKPKEDRDAENLIIIRGKRCFVMLNRYPYNNGHVMVVPYDHVSLPTEMDAETQAEMMHLVNVSIEVLTEAMHPDGFNIGMNVGAAAGAGIRDHVHMHVVPRWTGDTNFMPVLGDTRVIVEGLGTCYDKLLPGFCARCAVEPPPPAE